MILELLAESGTKATFSRSAGSLTVALILCVPSAPSDTRSPVTGTRINAPRSRHEAHSGRHITPNGCWRPCGQEVKGYRAPSFSIGRHNQWAFDCIRQADTATVPAFTRFTDHYSAPDAGCIPRASEPARAACNDYEVPARQFARQAGILRLLPYGVSRWLIRRVNCIDRRPAIFYFHPWR
jgi:hypothetical protein